MLSTPLGLSTQSGTRKLLCSEVAMLNCSVIILVTTAGLVSTGGKQLGHDSNTMQYQLSSGELSYLYSVASVKFSENRYPCLTSFIRTR